MLAGKIHHKNFGSMRGWFSHRLILAILLIGIAFRLYAIWDYKQSLSLHSDDEGYVQSAKWLIENGVYSYYAPHVPTLHMMPGITYLLAFFFILFGTGTTGLFAAKIGMSFIGICGLYGIYLIGRKLWHPYVGLVGAFIASIYLPGIETDTLLLTETPYMTASIFLLYFSVKAAQTHKLRDVLCAVLFFVIGIYFRPTVMLFPVLLLLYFVVKRYPWRLLIRHLGIAFVMVLMLLSPWWIRNAFDFHQFVPLTDGTGNPLLLGTYQGIRYPATPTMAQELNQILLNHPELEPPYLHEQAWMDAQKTVAIARMKTWYGENPQAFVQSYMQLKPTILWKDPFYSIQIFRVSKQMVENIQPYVVWGGIIGYFLAFLLGKKSKRESLLVLFTILYYTVLYSIYFAFGRYSEPMMPVVLLGIAVGVYSLVVRIFTLKLMITSRAK